MWGGGKSNRSKSQHPFHRRFGNNTFTPLTGHLNHIYIYHIDHIDDTENVDHLDTYIIDLVFAVRYGMLCRIICTQRIQTQPWKKNARYVVDNADRTAPAL